MWAHVGVEARALTGALFATALLGTATHSETIDASSPLVVLGGDCSFARGVGDWAESRGWDALLEGIQPVTTAADFTIVNLESPLAPCLSGGTPNRPRLCGDERGARALRIAGVDAVSLANNHALDAGREGLETTARLLRDEGIVPLGLSAVLNGQPEAEPLGSIAVIAANLTPPAQPPGSDVPIPSPTGLVSAVKLARHREPTRPVLVLLHLGRELDPALQPRDEAYARAAFEAGAAAVIMHGAHVVRRMVDDEGRPVHFGLGNLLFDQRAPGARRGALLGLRFTADGQVEVASVNCVDAFTSRLVDCDPADTTEAVPTD